MKSYLKIFFTILLFCFLNIELIWGGVFKESFSQGKTKFMWVPFPYYFLDNIKAVKDSNAPEGDHGVGILTNSNVGGFAALSYIANLEVSNFYLEAMIYCPVTEKERGPLVGIAFLIDPLEGRFYRLVCNFNKKEPSLNLAYIGKDTRHFPVYLMFWNEKNLPNGLPKKSEWQKIGIEVKNNKVIIYWNDKKLNEELDVSKINKGYVGVYTNFVGGFGLAETKVDYLILKILE